MQGAFFQDGVEETDAGWVGAGAAQVEDVVEHQAQVEVEVDGLELGVGSGEMAGELAALAQAQASLELLVVAFERLICAGAELGAEAVADVL